MSEPAKILTAEDVLTSIRRLLAQESGPVAAVAQVPAAPAVPLVLTPDFRVEEGPASGPAPAPAAEEARPAPAAEAPASAPPSLEDTLAALEAALTDRFSLAPVPADPPAVAPDTDTDTGSEPVAEEISASEAAPEAAEAPVATEEVEEAPFIAVDMPDASAPVAFRHTTEVRRLQLVTAPPVAEAISVPDESEDRATSAAVDAAPAPHDDPETAAAEPVSAETDAPTAPAGDSEPAAVMDPDTEAAMAAAAVAEPAAVDAVPAPAEPASSALTVPDVAAPVAGDMPDSDDIATETLLFDAPEEVPVSLDAVRHLVGEILRDELQGALGERMTRNVRKLVRAEIRRALAERDDV